MKSESIIPGDLYHDPEFMRSGVLLIIAVNGTLLSFMRTYYNNSIDVAFGHMTLKSNMLDDFGWARCDDV